MKPKVICHVNTCTHFLPGDLCGAANIDILHEEESKMSNTAEQTECKTFYHRQGITDYLGSMDNVNWGGIANTILTAGSKEVYPSVTCIVDSCNFWSLGNLCHADAIEVTGQSAKECQDTNCHTFVHK
ncbi:MAG: hypothetical protein FD169_2257 [Bacillota bacterium]|nr:MAG: hypothetical protein FD169_2257 [Bacillota bacterium]